MPDFSALSEAQRWEAAFYIFSLRFSAEDAAGGRDLAARKLPRDFTSPATLATSSDGELTEKLTAAAGNPQDAVKILAYLRQGLLQERKSEPLLAAQTYLREALELYEKGNQRLVRKG